jgi:hypothetical protein
MDSSMDKINLGVDAVQSAQAFAARPAVKGRRPTG